MPDGQQQLSAAAMKTAVIMTDSSGYPNRAEIMQRTFTAAGIPFVRASPADKPQDGTLVLALPAEWLPETRYSLADRNWFRCHLLFIEAIRASGIIADFFWCVEADVSASPATWLRLLETTEDMTHDGLWTHLRNRDNAPADFWFNDPYTPAWADWYCLGALFRISARAVSWLEECAVETREVFTEICAPSVIAKNGGTIGPINRTTHEPLYHCGTMRFNPGRSHVTPLPHPRRFRHPCKYDDPEPNPATPP
jgi:hypothetical protein